MRLENVFGSTAQSWTGICDKEAPNQLIIYPEVKLNVITALIYATYAKRWEEIPVESSNDKPLYRKHIPSLR